MEWCGEGGTHFLVELALRSSVATSLRERDAAAVWGYHAEVGHIHPVTRGVSPTAVELKGRGQGRGAGKVKGVNAKVHIMESGKKGRREEGREEEEGKEVQTHTHTLVGTT